MHLSQISGRFLIGLSLAAFATPLIAQGPHDETVVSATRYQENVGFEDLNLRLRDDQRMLRTRVRQASTRVCRDMAGDSVIAHSDTQVCSKQTYAETRPQIRRAIARVEAGQKVALSFSVGGAKKKS